MAKYRKVSVRVWNDEKFRSLGHDGQLVFLFLLTHPHTTSFGAMRGNLSGLSVDINMPMEAFTEAFRKASERGMVRHDERASLIYLPNFLKHNKPESPNVVKSWSSGYDELPECDLQRDILKDLALYIKGMSKAFEEAFAEAFPEAFRKAMPNQEQEQKQEQEQEQKGSPKPPLNGNPSNKFQDAFNLERDVAKRVINRAAEAMGFAIEDRKNRIAERIGVVMRERELSGDDIVGYWEFLWSSGEWPPEIRQKACHPAGCFKDDLLDKYLEKSAAWKAGTYTVEARKSGGLTRTHDDPIEEAEFKEREALLAKRRKKI